MAHEYTPDQALDLLIRKLEEKDPELSSRVQQAVNSGKDIQVEESKGTARKSRRRAYRRTVPYTPAEALLVALDVLRANFLEQPSFMNSFLENFRHAALGIPVGRVSIGHAVATPTMNYAAVGENKKIEIELRTATELLAPPDLQRQGFETQYVAYIASEEISEQQANLEELHQLLKFSEG